MLGWDKKYHITSFFSTHFTFSGPGPQIFIKPASKSNCEVAIWSWDILYQEPFEYLDESPWKTLWTFFKMNNDVRCSQKIIITLLLITINKMSIFFTVIFQWFSKIYGSLNLKFKYS